MQLLVCIHSVGLSDRFFLLFYIGTIDCANYISITTCILISLISIKSHSSKIHGRVFASFAMRVI